MEQECPVVELRQYTTHPGTRDTLVRVFEQHLIEDQERCGMRVLGQFRDLGDPDRFVWLRGFADMERAHAGAGGVLLRAGVAGAPRRSQCHHDRPHQRAVAEARRAGTGLPLRLAAAAAARRGRGAVGGPDAGEAPARDQAQGTAKRGATTRRPAAS